MGTLEKVHTVKFESEDESKIEIIDHVLKEQLPQRFFDNVTVIHGTENR